MRTHKSFSALICIAGLFLDADYYYKGRRLVHFPIATDKEYNGALCDDQIIPGKAIKQSVTVR